MQEILAPLKFLHTCPLLVSRHDADKIDELRLQKVPSELPRILRRPTATFEQATPIQEAHHVFRRPRPIPDSVRARKAG
jgi:hypothetical protein